MNRIFNIVNEYQNIQNTYDGSKEAFAIALDKIIDVKAKTEALIDIATEPEVIFLAKLTLENIEKERKYVNGVVNGRGRKTRYQDIMRYAKKVNEYKNIVEE